MTTPNTERAVTVPTTEDRQRRRAERGLRSSQQAGTRTRTVKPPRRRRPMLALLAVLLIVGGAAIAGLLAVRLDARQDVVVLGTDVAPGEKITVDMLSKTPVASEGLMLVPVDQAESVIGTYARVPISKGQLLDTSMLTSDDPIQDGYAVVGAPVAAGRMPSGVQAGDVLRLVRLSASGSAVEPLATGLVTRSATQSEEGLVGEGDSSQTVMIMVPEEASDEVVDAIGTESIGASLVQRGAAIDNVDLRTLGGGS